MFRYIRSASLIFQSARALGLIEPATVSSSTSTSTYKCCSVSPFDTIVKRWKVDDRSALIKSTPVKDMGTHGEKQLDVDLLTISNESVYPDADTPNLLFDGVRYAELPICHIKTSKNNTHIHFTDHKGAFIVYHTCGKEGFKNTRKGTNIAAQTAAVNIGNQVLKKGMRHIRVKIQGLGPGRISAVKGLQMTGLNIVSVTDNTPISFTPPRPRKARRL